MTEPVTSLVETVNQLRMQYHATGTELTADAASQILHQKMQQGAFAGQSISPLDIDSAVAQSFGLAEMAATTSSALAVLWDVVTQVAQFTVTLGLALTLAGMLCLALINASLQFSHSAQSSRDAVQQSTSVRSLTKQLQSIGRDPKAASQREQLVRDIKKKLQPDE